MMPWELMCTQVLSRKWFFGSLHMLTHTLSANWDHDHSYKLICSLGIGILTAHVCPYTFQGKEF